MKDKEQQIERGRRIVQHMYANDPFSQWLGIEIKEVQLGRVILKMEVREEMTNGFGIAHGGISYSLTDSALAFASNTYGPQAVSIETSVAHTHPVRTGDRLIATAEEEHRSRRIGRYRIEIKNQSDETVALFRGTVFIKEREWDI